MKNLGNIGTFRSYRLHCGLALLACLLPAPEVAAKVRLPRLVSDGMVLQRDAELRVWGWAAPGEALTLHFRGKKYPATADAAGRWQLRLPRQKAGGPYELRIVASNTLTVKDILVGDVWLCSGQSNMELPMRRVRDRFPEVVAQAANPRIRQFAVPMRYEFRGPRPDVATGQWTAATPETVLDFTAVGYFFALELQARYQVPVGLIKCAVGGSPAEAWLSTEALQAFPNYLPLNEKYRDTTLIADTRQREAAATVAWYHQLHQADLGEAPGQPRWWAPAYDAHAWPTLLLPGYWADQTRLGAVNGVLWFRKEVEVPASMAGQPARLELGTLVDADSTYVNGQLVGTTGYQYPPRKYDLPAGLLRPGKNVIVVRLVSTGGRGGFTPDKPYQLTAGSQVLDLRGVWQYQLGAALPPAPASTTFQYQPGGLFNGMIAPLLPYALKGVLWYQGESNTKNPAEYQPLMTSLLADWRRHFEQPQLPFVYAQLANYMVNKPLPGESSWASLRDAQRRLLAQPRTGMAVLTDVGEWNDIHPLDKQTVGRRLALAARRVAYGESQLVASGPLFQAAQPAGSQLVLRFSEVGGGLLAKGGAPLGGFTIAGADHRFVPAQARIENNQVVVWSEQVPTPVAVRYAWADNPIDANLINREGLPASPFRTDDF